ncbi:TolC family outer membrane protein [Ferrimonas pelagia]|uniref:TolC family outer membrane protein n=1 Tax=Ferrimonas pelagia TaxID=1177826 RepID=A0ABP9F9H3_9GAMM
MNRTLVILSTILAFNAAATPKSLEQEVAFALESNPNVRQAFHELASRSESIRGAYSGYQPTLDVEGGIGYQKLDNTSTRFSGNDEFDPTEISLTLRQYLFQGFEISENVTRNRAEAEAQRYQLLSDADGLALRVVEVYLALLRQQQQYLLSEKNRDVHQAIYNDIRRRTEQGVGSNADLSQISARLSRANSNLISAQNNLKDAEDEYLRVTNHRPPELIRPEVDAQALPGTIDTALSRALHNNPTLGVAHNDIDAAVARRKISKSGFYPEFYIEVKQSWEDETRGQMSYINDFSAALKMKWNLFNGSANHAEVTRDAYQIQVAKDIRENSIRQLQEGTRLAWNAWQFTQKQKGFLQGHVEASYDTAQAYKKQFDIGRRTLLDLLNTENELFEARSNYLEAEYAEIEAKYRLLNATGDLMPALRITLPESWLETRR